MVNVVSVPKNHTNGYPKIAISTEITNNKTEATIDHGHNLVRKPRTLTGRCARHYLSGLSILVAVALASIARNIGPKPPPTRNNMIERSSRTPAPFFR